MHAEICRTETDKPVEEFVAEFARAASRKGFVIHNKSQMEMAQTFGRHGVEVAAGRARPDERHDDPQTA